MDKIIAYLSEHPMYIPFVLLNVYLIYRVFVMAFNQEDDDDEDDRDDMGDGGVKPDGPKLDLPPGVGLPVDGELVEEGV